MGGTLRELALASLTSSIDAERRNADGRGGGGSVGGGLGAGTVELVLKVKRLDFGRGLLLII